MRPAIPADVRDFILKAVPSVPYLEALLLLRGAGAAGLSAGALAAGLYVSEQAAGALLGQLGAADVAGATAMDGVVRYAPPDDVAALIDRLAGVYADNLIGVSMLIHSTSSRRARDNTIGGSPEC